MVMNNLVLVQYTKLFHVLSIQNLILSDKSITFFLRNCLMFVFIFFPFLYFFF